METLKYILEKYNLPMADKIEIPNVGRDDLAALCFEMNFQKGVEIGVQRGLYSEVLCIEAPSMMVYGVDPWVTFKTCDADDSMRKTESHAPQELCEQFYEETKKRMSPYENYQILREYSIDAVKRFDDESIDFVYIDGNHQYDFVMNDIREWTKKLKKGGIMSGHDYYRIADKRALMHVKEAVDTYVSENKIKPLIIWGAQGKAPGTIRDRWRSWSWVKE